MNWHWIPILLLNGLCRSIHVCIFKRDTYCILQKKHPCFFVTTEPNWMWISPKCRSGLELRIWKGEAIYKKGSLDLGEHFGQAKGHQGHPRKGTKAKKKGQQIRGGGGGGTPTHFCFRLQNIFPQKSNPPKKKKTARRHGTETAQLTQLHFNAIMYAMRRDLTLAWNYINNWQKYHPFVILVFEICSVLLISS